MCGCGCVCFVVVFLVTAVLFFKLCCVRMCVCMVAWVFFFTHAKKTTQSMTPSSNFRLSFSLIFLCSNRQLKA